MSMFNIVTKNIDLGDGRTITIETGKMARQADGAVVVKMGETMLLATVVSARKAGNEVDFMPLTVEYQQKFASTGRIPGGFLRREGRPSDDEILVSRLVDRALRPLFPEDYHADTFVVMYLISSDKETMPDSLAGLAASAAIAVSDVPFNGPMAEVRVSRIDGKFRINPTFTENQNADIEIVIGGTKDQIVMIEGEMSEVSEEDMLQAIKFGHEAIKQMCIAQIELAEQMGIKKREYCHEIHDEDLRAKLSAFSYDKVMAVAKSGCKKGERHDQYQAIKEEFVATLSEEQASKGFLINQYFNHVEYEVVRKLILEQGLRVDGRNTEQIRPIVCETDILPAAHGSALFTRGETQSLTTVTMGTKMDEKIIDDAIIQDRYRFMLHYNFPPFSTGDARPNRGTSRREIGHGNLAFRALKRMLPDTPYTIRIVSDILESNGSSSMATVCAGTLALMDSGLKIKKPVSGIAMGLITDEATGKFAVLSDILGDEDHLGDMDFKVTGTADGITACQMDIKVKGLTFEIMSKALHQAKQGRMHILGKMLETIAAPRADYKPHVPRIEQIIIPKELIGALIGPGGKVIQEIQESTGSVITIEEKDGKGYVDVSSANKASIDKAMMRIKGIVEQPELGKIYMGKVKTLVEFGAFIEILPGKDGLLHVSEIDHKRVESAADYFKVGDQVEVKLIDIDPKTKKLKLSRKVLIPKN